MTDVRNIRHTPFLVVTLLLISDVSLGNENNISPHTSSIEVEAGATYEWLSRNYADWRSGHVELLKKFDRTTSLYGTFRRTERFTLADNEVSVGGYYPLGKNWTLSAEGSLSSNKVLPQWTATAQVQKTFTRGWVASLGLRRMNFSQRATHILPATIERYWGNFRASYTLYVSRVNSSTPLAHRLWGSWYYDDENSLNVSFTVGKEVENVGPNRVVESQVLAVSLFGRHWFTSAIAASFEALVHQQGDFYTRRGIRCGLRCRF